VSQVSNKVSNRILFAGLSLSVERTATLFCSALKFPETDSDWIPRGLRAPHSDRSDETIKGKQSEFYMAMSKFSDQISVLEQLAILKLDFFRFLYI
jgi:hypothetical protein